MSQSERNKKSTFLQSSVRISGVVIPNKRIVIALTYVHGIGLTYSKKLCAALNIDENTRIYALTDEQLASVRDYIAKHYIVEGDLRKVVVDNIKNLIRKGTYRGSRHKRSLPVRGQRTKTNARTRKGRSAPVANKKKVTK